MKRLFILLLPLALLFSCSGEPEEVAMDALYQGYASRQELKVAKVVGLQLCDTVSIDVVLLQAEDEAAWRQMAGEFGLQDTTGTTSWLGDTADPTQHVAWDGEPVVRVIASHKRQTIGLYRIENETQYNALIDYQLNRMKNQE